MRRRSPPSQGEDPGRGPLSDEAASSRPAFAKRRLAGRSRSRRSSPTAPTATTPRFRSKLHARELEYLLAVSAQISVYGPETTFAVPERNGSVGRRRSVARPDRKPESVRALAKRLPPRAWQTLPCHTTPAGEDVRSRFAFVRVVATHPVRNNNQPAREEWLIIEWPEGRRGTERLLALQPGRRRRAASGSPGSRGCAGRSSSTTASSKASSDSTTTKAAATSASITTPRSSPAPTPSSPSSAYARKPGGRSDAAADGAAPPAHPALLGRPLPNLPPTRQPQPARPRPQTGATKSY